MNTKERRRKMDANKMKTDSIDKLIINISLPMMISMLIQSLYNIVDSIFVSKISADAFTALSLSFPLQSLIIAFATGIGVGFNSLLSRALGEKNKDKASLMAKNGIFVEFINFIIFLIVGLFLIKPFFKIQTDSETIIQYGYDYLKICCCFSFGIFGQIGFSRILQATGKTFYSMLIQLIGAFLNIILDPLLIFGIGVFPKLGVKGAAIATVISQIVGFFFAVFFNKKINKDVDLSFKKFSIDFKAIKKIYAIGFPATIMQALSSFMVFGLNKILLSISLSFPIIFGVFFRLQSFAFMPVIGLTNGIIPIVSYNYGAKEKHRIIQTIKLSSIYASVIMIIFMIALQIFPQFFISFFEISPKILNDTILAVKIISISFIFIGFCSVISAVLQALGNGFLSMLISFFRQIIVLLPLAFVLSKMSKTYAVWFAFPIAEFFASILSLILLYIVYNKKIKNIGFSK